MDNHATVVCPVDLPHDLSPLEDAPSHDIHKVGGEAGDDAAEDDVVADDDEFVAHTGLVRLRHGWKGRWKEKG